MQVTALELLRMTAHTALTFGEMKVSLAAHGFRVSGVRLHTLINSLNDPRLIARTFEKVPDAVWTKRPVFAITARGLSSLNALRTISKSQ